MARSARRLPHPLEQRPHRLRGLRHGVVQAIPGEGGVAEQPRPLGAQPHGLGDDRLVVGRPAAVAAGDPGEEGLLAQVAPARRRQERLDAGACQGDRVFARVAALLSGLLRRRPLRGAQAGEVVLGFQHQGIRLLVGEHVLAERGAERGEPLPDLGDAPLAGGVEAGSGAAEGHLVALQHARLLGRKSKLRAAIPQRA